MNYPDYRGGGKIFASFGYPDKTRAMVKLSPAQQEEFVTSHPKMFAPVNGARGRPGLHTLYLKTTTKALNRPKPLLEASLRASAQKRAMNPTIYATEYMVMPLSILG